MINSQFIIQYTNALYSTPAVYSPRYEEFRDMFSAGQVFSKEWIINELYNLNPEYKNQKFAIAGSWFGTLGLMLKYKFPSILINLIDIDDRCRIFGHNLVYDNPAVQFITADMFTYRFTEDVIINTSCEHILNLKDWIKTIPENRIIALQSNNARNIAGHVNCVDSMEEFIEKSGIKKILFSGQLTLPMYTRFMIIGKT